MEVIPMQYQYDFFSAEEAGLSKDVWQCLGSSGTPVLYAKEQIIYMQGERAIRFYYLTTGQVKTFISSERGGEKILTVYRAGDIFGEASFFDEMPRVSSAVALTDCKIIPVDRDTILRYFQADPHLALSMLKYLARTVRMLGDQVDSISFLPADKRVAALLLKLCGGNEGKINCTHEEISKTVGVSRVTVSRILNDFSKKGWISTSYRSVDIKDCGKLEDFTVQ